MARIDNKILNAIDLLVEYLPTLRDKSAVETCCEWVKKGSDDGADWSAAYPRYAPWARQLLSDAAGDYITVWNYWEYLEENDIGSFQDVQLDELGLYETRCILTQLVRSERFCEGDWESAIVSGAVERCIVRLEELAAAYRARPRGRRHPACPSCGSTNTAKILYGMPAFSDELQLELREGLTVIGGCCILVDEDGNNVSPTHRCNTCGNEFVRPKRVRRGQ